MMDFSAGQLIKVLQELERDSFDGAAEVIVDEQKIKAHSSRIFIFRQGKLVFAHSQLITPAELATKIGSYFKIGIVNAALKTARTKVTNPNSFEETFAFLERMRILKSQQIEAFVLQQIILSLEQLLPYGGKLHQKEVDFDLTPRKEATGWSFAELMPLLSQRQQKWRKFASVGINPQAIPKVSLRINEISNSFAQKHCREWIDGQSSINEIAEKSEEDPLKLATNYYSWVDRHWIYFGDRPPTPKLDSSAVADAPPPETGLPTVLSVDDSPVVQTMLKRSLSDRYNVILAHNGMDALKILNSKRDIKLVLLDVTMPDIDGIELCRTIRRFKKFQQLPIIMLTAKDGMLDKVKGKFAGSTEYLTKPVDREALLTTIAKYVPSLVE